MSTPINHSQLTYYQILEVSEEATPKEITRAYKMKALKYHPDKALLNHLTVEKANELFLQISKAFEVLSNANARAEYDRKLAETKNINQKNKKADFHQNSPENENINFNEIEIVMMMLTKVLIEEVNRFNLDIPPTEIKEFFAFIQEMFSSVSYEEQSVFISAIKNDPRTVFYQTFFLNYEIKMKKEMEKRKKEMANYFFDDKNIFINLKKFG